MHGQQALSKLQILNTNVASDSTFQEENQITHVRITKKDTQVGTWNKPIIGVQR